MVIGTEYIYGMDRSRYSGCGVCSYTVSTYDLTGYSTIEYAYQKLSTSSYVDNPYYLQIALGTGGSCSVNTNIINIDKLATQSFTTATYDISGLSGSYNIIVDGLGSSNRVYYIYLK